MRAAAWCCAVAFASSRVVFAAEQWALTQLDIPRTAASSPRAEETSPPRVVVAVVDTGVDLLHPGLPPANQWRNASEVANGLDDDGDGYVDDLIGWNFVDGDNMPWDDCGHGTHVAGIIAAATDDPNGVVGIAPTAVIMPLKVASFAGHARSDAIAAAIRYAVGHRAQIVNLSLGGDEITQAERDALDEAAKSGVLVVAAAGNSARADAYGYAAVPSVLVVGASARDEARASFSNGGARLDLVAPGEDIVSLRARGTDFILTSRAEGYSAGGAFAGDGLYYRASGTSFAAAVVSGVAARVLTERPALAPSDVKRVLMQSAKDLGVPGVDAVTGYGRVDYRAALAQDPQRFIEARIDSVVPLLRDRTVWLDVAGDANADDFADATLALAGASGDDGVPIGAPIAAPVAHGLLARLDLADVMKHQTAEPARAPSAHIGEWLLELTVRGTRGEVRSARMRISLPDASSAPVGEAKP